MKTLSDKKPKAIKEHTCDFCLLKIEKGAVYNNSSHVFDGHVYTWKSHLNCMSLLKALNMESSDYGVDSDTFIEYVYNAYDGTHGDEDVPFVNILNNVMKNYL